MLVTPENYGDQLYWRLYIRPQIQDGSQGEPLRSLPFDLTARYNYDPTAYDQGGKWMESIPSGYWVDLTALASQFNWQRLPALPNWRTYFKGTRFNEFVLRDGLDWRSAMLELYPPEILITPTPVKTPKP
jgi:TolB protein